MSRNIAFATRLTVVLALVASTQGLLFVQGAFSLNQAWVVENLCVNRDRPELNCNGHCVLSERLHEEQEREDSQNTANLTVALAVSALVAESECVPPDVEATTAPYAAQPVIADAKGEDLGVFRPPRAA